MISRVLALLLFSSFMVSVACAGAQKWHVLSSPDKAFAIEFSLSSKGRPLYRVQWREDAIIVPGGIGFIEKGGTDWTRGFKEIHAGNSSIHDSTWKPVWGERSSVRDHYRAATFTFRRGVGTAVMKIEARAYDHGVAFRYLVDAPGSKKSIRIETEETRFRFTGDHDVWAVYSAQGKYSKVKVGDIKHSIERPCVLETGDGKVIAIAEAAMVDFSRMRLRRSSGEPNTLVSRLQEPVTASLPMQSPWRVVMAADSAGQLLENNDILLNLNEPGKIADTGWIRPGKVIREVTLSTKGGLACVDFAVRYGLQFIEFDAGWYGHEADEASDARTVSRRDLDLPRVIKYAREKGIGVILYVNRRHLERDLDELLPIYREWGIAGLKFGFVRHGDQKWTRWMHEAIAKCAEYKLMVDVHDEYRMTGWQRTYPNFMTAEGIGGDETRPTNKQALANLFNRMIAGPADHTFCYYSAHVDQVSSHASQLAKSVCFFSPWQFLFWYDRPSSAQDEPELEFFRELPTTWDDTRVLHGEIGRYAAIARRSGEQWFIGCFNGGKPRMLDLSLSFLEEGKKYEMRRYFDHPGSGTRTRVGIEKSVVDHKTVLKESMGARGGVALRIFPLGQGK